MMRDRAFYLVGLAWFLSGVGCESAPPAQTPDAGGRGGAAAGGATAGNPALGGKSGAASGGMPAVGGTSAGASTGGGGSAGTGGAGGSAGGSSMLPGTPIVFVGGYGSNYPLRVYDLDKATGALTQRGGDFDAGSDPSYLALDPSRTHLYAANEAGGAEGGITALSINADGSLTLLNHEQGSDDGFTHLGVDPTGKFVIGASYNGGSVSVFPIAADGSVGAELDNADFGPDSKAHAVAYDATGKYVLVPTLGNNGVEQLLLGTDGMLSANTPANVVSANGAGPRHIAVHPSGKLAFVINESNSTVTPYQLSADGKLTAGTTLPSLPGDFNGSNSGAHIEVSPNGRFVYASNRGHHSIVVYSADPVSGALTLVEHEPTRGNTPRDFDVDPNGDVLIVANEDSNNLSVYTIEDDGKLTPLGAPVAGPPRPAAVQIHYLK